MLHKFAWFLAVLLMAFSGAAPTAEEIAAKSTAALGGIEKFRAVKTRRVSGTISFGTQAQGPFVVELKRPNKIREEFTLGGQTIIRAFDGAKGWQINPMTGGNEPRALSSEETRNISEEADFDSHAYVDAPAKGNKVELAGPEKVEDHDSYKLKITLKNGDVHYTWIDAQSYLPIKWEAVLPREGVGHDYESYFRNYKPAQGILYAFEVDSDEKGGGGSEKILTDKIELNVPEDDSRFSMPQAPASAPTESAPEKKPGR